MLSGIRRHFDSCILYAVNTETYDMDELKHVLRAIAIVFSGMGLAVFMYLISSSEFAAGLVFITGVAGGCIVMIHGLLSILIRVMYDYTSLLDNAVDRARTVIELKHNPNAKYGLEIAQLMDKYNE